MGQVLIFPRPASEPPKKQEVAQKKEQVRPKKLRRRIKAAKKFYLKLL